MTNKELQRNVIEREYDYENSIQKNQSIDISRIKLYQESQTVKLFEEGKSHKLKEPFNVHEASHYFLQDLAYESLIVYALDDNNNINAVREIHRGTLNSCLFGIREILLFALLNDATAIIAVHNHPSLDPLTIV